jgi:hypothetical protein
LQLAKSALLNLLIDKDVAAIDLTKPLAATNITRNYSGFQTEKHHEML